MKLKFLFRGIHPSFTYMHDSCNSNNKIPWIWVPRKILDDKTSNEAAIDGWLVFQSIEPPIDDPDLPWRVYEIKRVG